MTASIRFPPGSWHAGLCDCCRRACMSGGCRSTPQDARVDALRRLTVLPAPQILRQAEEYPSPAFVVNAHPR